MISNIDSYVPEKTPELEVTKYQLPPTQSTPCYTQQSSKEFDGGFRHQSSISSNGDGMSPSPNFIGGVSHPQGFPQRKSLDHVNDELPVGKVISQQFIRRTSKELGIQTINKNYSEKDIQQNSMKKDSKAFSQFSNQSTLLNNTGCRRFSEELSKNFG